MNSKINEKNGINVLSLFDGISVARQALKELGVKVNKYYASEIDNKAIEVSHNNHPDIIQLGDIRNLDVDELPIIDVLFAGSPCQDLSGIRVNREGINGPKSSLFFNAVEILNKLRIKNPNILFLFENVSSMSLEDKNIISQHLDVEPTKICSSMLTAQLRKRYYWTNINNVTVPKPLNIKFQDIVESGYVNRDKSLVVLTASLPMTLNGLKRYLFRGIGQLIFEEEFYVIRGVKNSTLELCYDAHDYYKDDDGLAYHHGFRRPTIIELCRLQGLPDDYMNGIAYTTAHRCLGNSFTNPVIQHILSFIDFHEK